MDTLSEVKITCGNGDSDQRAPVMASVEQRGGSGNDLAASNPEGKITATEWVEWLRASGVIIRLPEPKKYTSKYLRWCKWMISYGAGPQRVYSAFRNLGRRRIRVLYKKIYYPMDLRPPF